MIGGYKIVDLGGVNLSDREMTIDGIYSKIESAVGKPLLIKNFSFENVEVPAFFASVYAAGQYFYMLRMPTQSNLHRVVVGSNNGVRYLISSYTVSQDQEPGMSDEPSASI